MTIATASGNVYEDDIDHALDRPMQVAGKDFGPGGSDLDKRKPPVLPITPSPPLVPPHPGEPGGQFQDPHGPLPPPPGLFSNNDFYLIRHGSTALNDPGNERIRGWSD